jgi:ABC-type transport system involved in multi-copper enzyme maturation permease subunit
MKLAAIRWLIADTFRHSLWSGVFWLSAAASAVAVVFCFCLGPAGWATTEAGARDALFWLGGFGANTLGVLLAIVFTAGFIPAFVDPNSAMILLAKPLPRWQMLAGRVIGVLFFFAAHATVFVAATWFATGISTGFWPIDYLAVLPVLLLNFAAFFAFSVLIAVMTRNLVATVIATVIFFGLCAMMNIGRHLLAAHDLEQFSAMSRLFSEFGYWLFPKPADLIAMLYNAIEPQPLASQLSEFAKVQEKGAFHPGLSLAASLLFPTLTLAIAGYEMEKAEY